MNKKSYSTETLLDRIQFLEKQCRSLRMNVKYQRYHLLRMNDHLGTDNETTNLLLRLVPYKFRSVEKVKSLAYSNHSWKEIMWRHPLKVKLWITVKHLQRGERKK